jgi:hypothetical protein
MEIDNFITKFYDILGGNYLATRLQLQQERSTNVCTTNVPSRRVHKFSVLPEKVCTFKALNKQTIKPSAGSRDVRSSSRCKEQVGIANATEEQAPEANACGEQVSNTSECTKASVTLDFQFRNWRVLSWKNYVPGQRPNPTPDFSISSTSLTPRNSSVVEIVKWLSFWIGMLFVVILLGLIIYGTLAAWVASYRRDRRQGFNSWYDDVF